jgi:RNA polymerase sigma factor (sigma-70 family)
MAPAGDASPERTVLRRRAGGEVSAEESFEELYRLHSGSVRAWLCSRVGVSAAEDLMQDVWLVFHHRWQRWEFPPEMEAESARPVLSFLFRTCHFVLRGHQRRRELRGEIPTGVLEAADGSKGAESVERGAEAGHALRLAQRLCPPEERDVLLAKLAGVPAREIAETLGLSEAIVDHRFRDALARLKTRLAPKPALAKGGRRG